MPPLFVTSPDTTRPQPSASRLIFGDVPLSPGFEALLALNGRGKTRLLQPLRRRCAWCLKDLGGYHEAEKVSHGICGPCAERWLGARA